MKNSVLKAVVSAFIALWAAVSSVIATGCGGVPGYRGGEGLFRYSLRPFSVSVTLRVGEGVSEFEYTRSDEGEYLEFTAPKELCGYSMSQVGGTGTVSVGDLCVQPSEELMLPLRIASAVFSVKDEEVTEIAPTEVEGRRLTLVSVGEITLALGQDGLPCGARGVLFGVAFSMEIDEFTAIAEKSADGSALGENTYCEGGVRDGGIGESAVIRGVPKGSRIGNGMIGLVKPLICVS